MPWTLSNFLFQLVIIIIELHRQQGREIMKRDKYQSLALPEKLLRLKETYLQGKYQQLIIHDQYIYPPIEKDIKEILISQFGISLLDQYIRNFTEQKLTKKTKFPLPIIFAFIHHNIKANRYENLVRMIMQHVDRKGVEHFYILIYIIAKIYERFKQYKKSIFYLENLLKESPFFSQAVYDLCFHYAFKFQREQEACSILERHIGHCQPNQKLIHSLYICICSKSKARNTKDVMKALNNRSMNLIAYYNLGIFLRQNEDLQKAFEIFTEIIAKISKAKQDQSLNFTQKDKKMLLFSKINLLMILKNQSFQQNKSSQHVQLLTKQIQSTLGYNLDHQAMSKISLYKQNSNSISSQSLKSQKIFRNFFSTRKSKELSAFKQYKQEKTVQNEQKSIQNKENYKLSSFNNDFSTIREYNNKKLKYLLEKQKEINQFFKNLVIKKDQNSDKMHIQYKMRQKLLKVQASQLSIIKAKSLNNDEFQFFQKQFENKRKIHQFKYDNIELEYMLSQIMTNFETCVADNKAQSKTSSVAKSYAPTLKTGLSRQNSQPSKHRMLQNTPKSSLGPRKTQKSEKRIVLSQMSSRALKSDRGGNFRIKPLNKEPHQQIKEQKQEQLIVEPKESVVLPTLRKPNKPKQMDHNQQKKKSQNCIIKQNKLEKVEKRQQVAENKKKNQEQPSLDHEDIDSNHEAALSAPLSAHNSKQNSSHTIVSKSQIHKEIVSERQQKHTEKSIVSDLNEHTEGHTQIKEVADNEMLQSHTSSMGCYTRNPSDRQIPQPPTQQQPVHEQTQNQVVEEKVQQVKNQVIEKQDQILSKPIQEKTIQQTKTPPTQQKVDQAEAPIIQTEQLKKQPEPEPEPKPQPINIPESKPAYDPFASSFQLTGFGKASLSKFRDLKKKRKTSPRQSVKQQESKVLEEPPAKNIEEPKPPKNMSQFQQQIKEGQALEKAEKYQEAYQLYTRLYKTYKKQTQKQIVLIKIGSLFQTQQKHAEAEKTYLKCTKFNNVEAFIKLGALLLKNGRINSGVENIEKANCLKRNDLQIENKLVYGYSLREQTMEKALDLAQMILKKEPQSLETLIITANILEKQGKIKEAIDIMTAIDKFKSAEYIKHYLGVLYLQDSNLTEAFNHFKAALSIKADYLPSLIEVATIISEISPKQSISILEKVLEIEPHNRKALARLGKIYESIENDFGSAMNAYQTALQTQENYESYMKIGDCLARQQSYIEALINYKEALNMKKTHEAYAKVANMFQMKEEFTKAIQNYEQALNLLVAEKDNCAKKKEYLTYLGNLSLKIGNYDAGIKFFEEIDDYEESIDILKLLAEAYFGKKQYSIALQKYQKASELSHGQKLDILQNIAICFDKMEQYLASKTIYEKILEKNPENIRCMNNLANILLITGETNESFYLFESMLQKAPKNLEKRLKVVDIYAEVGDWSKVEFHLLQCLKQKENDERVIERLINLYKEKRDIKMANKYEKRLAIMKTNRKGQQKAATYS